MSNRFNKNEAALGEALREISVAWIEQGLGTGEDAVHVILAHAAALLEAMTCCTNHYESNLAEMAQWFVGTGKLMHDDIKSVGTCPDVGAASVPGLKTQTPEAILADPGDGVVAYAGQVFGAKGLRPVFLACLHREIIEKMITKGGGFDVDVDVDGKRLNVKLFARETRQDALDLIGQWTMTEKQAKAVAELQTATKQ
jgi:hypothetical protein